MPIRRSAPTVTSSTRLGAVAIAWAVLVLAAASPAAADTPSFHRAFGFGPPSICAASCAAAAAGAGSGQLSAPLATAIGGGEVYVADSASNRISVFTIAGSFVRAFGKGVNPGGANPDICTAACAAGSAGTGAGELSSPTGVAVSGTQVFVADSQNFRISVFTTAGVFVRAVGAGVNPGGPNTGVCTATCQAGTQGPGDREFAQMRGLTVASGQIYVADEGNNRISQFTTAPTGELTRVFGKDVGGAGVDVCASSCQAGTASAGGEAGVLSDPTAVVVGATTLTMPPSVVTEIFVADRTDNRVSVLSTAGVFQRAFGKGVGPGGGDVCTTASTCQRGSAGAGAGELGGARGIAFAAGEVYVAEAANRRVSVLSRLGTFARAFGANVDPGGGDVCTATCGPGSGGGAGGVLDTPVGLAISGGEVAVADSTNNRVSVSTTDGAFVRAFARNVAAPPFTCTAATGCRTGAPGFAAGQLDLPGAAAVSGGEVFVADANNHRIGVYATDGTFARAFGKGVDATATNADVCTSSCEAGATGSDDGALASPAGVVVAAGDVYVADQANDRVSRFSTSGAFDGQIGSSGSGAGQLLAPAKIAIAGGELYVADQSNHRISVFDLDGTFQHAFGKDVGGTGVDVCTTMTGCAAGTNAGSSGALNFPVGVAVSGDEAFVTDFNLRVSVFDTDGAFLRAFAKGVELGGANGDICTTACEPGLLGGAAGQLIFPQGVTVSRGELYVADAGNNRIDVFTPAGTFLRAFGRGVDPSPADADVCTLTCESGALGGAAGQLCNPFDVSVSGAAELYVADQCNHRVSVFDVPQTSLGASPPSLAFGNQDIDDSPGPVASTTITNTGTQTVTLAGLAVTGSDASDFELLAGMSGDCAGATVLASDESCTARVRFDPGTTGPKSASLTVTSGLLSVALSGAGTQTQLSRAPGSLAFGEKDIDDGSTATQTSIVTNSGTELVTFTALELSGDTGDFVRETGGAGECTAATSLNAGQSCTLYVHFDPATTGAKAATLTITSNAGTTSVDLSGTGIQTSLAVSPGTLPFGPFDVDDGATAPQSAVVTNTGTQPVSLTGVAIAGSDPDDFDLVGQPGDCTAATTLVAGGECSLHVSFDPTDTGSKSATLVLSTTTLPDLAAVALLGTGTQTRLSSSFASHNFPQQDIDAGPSAPVLLDFANTGTEPVMITGFSISGDDAGQFAIVSGAPSECAVATVLAVGESCFLLAVFDPTTTGAKAASLNLASAAPSVSIALTGNGIQTELSRSPDRLDFDPRDIDDGASDLQTSTVTNTGTQPVSLSGVSLTGGDAPHFVLLAEAGDCTASTTLSAGETCAVRVRFDPATTGVKTATVSVTSPQVPTLTVTVEGRGIQTELTPTPGALPFGPQHIGDGSTAPQTSTVANTGTQPVTLTGVVLGGTDPGEFAREAVVAGDCDAGTVLTAGQTCALRAHFDPTSTGAKSATLTVSSNAADVVVTLTGTGTLTRLEPAPGTLAFGDLDIDDGATLSLGSAVTNTGSEPVTLTAVTLAGTDASQFAHDAAAPGDCGAGTVLTTGQHCDVRAHFDPSSTGPKSATLTVSSNAADVTVALTGRGTQTQLSRGPASLELGARDIDEGPTLPQTSTVTNTGTEPVSLTGLAITGDAGQFERLTAQGSDCLATTTLTAGQTCELRVRFDPTTTGAKAATLTVSSSVPDLTVGLTGTGTQTELSRSPAALAFGAKDIDDGATGPQAAVVTNSGTEPVTFTAATITGAAASSFERLTTQGTDCTPTTILTAGQTCELRAHFDPATVGAKAAALTVTSNAAAIAVALTGTAVQTELSPPAATIAFGARDVDGGPSAIQQSTVTNSGTEPVTLTAVTLSGTDAGQFERVPGEASDCGAGTALVAGAACNVRARFDPASTGAKSATLTVSSNAAAVTVALSGSGSVTPPVDSDGDGTPDAADPDDDNDGVADGQDAFPLNAGESADFDADGVGDRADTDDDNDGVPDASDAFPRNRGESLDTDRDGIGNNADTDDDGDGFPDTVDALPLNGGESVDTDRDGIGNNADTDDDGDGVVDARDVAPLDPSLQAARWRLVRRAELRVTRTGTRVTVATGYAAVCPANGSPCTGSFTLTARVRSPRTRRLSTVTLSPRLRVTVAAGTEKRLTLRLNTAGASLLRRRGTLTATLRGSLTSRGYGATAHSATLRLRFPR